ncbi:protein-tyrosine phosphatase-like protein [Boletus edulis BED1]|uniref:Protein-tyrosine phosphatase-like protein n=1 Tax=Boletus edulis BED1 TaxID=1328754 RepID=A0AAD4BQW1_BOLED|nr:protein-tyrosine phosphatase-like protein [Boletus edulis BED1]
MTATDNSLEALDPVYVADILSRPPFVQISGVCNVRDLGSYPTTTPNLITKPGYAFRSAEVSHITVQGMQQMRALGITTVFDLRSDPEMQKYSTPIPTIEGVQILRAPVFKSEDYSPETMARRFELYASGTTEAFMKLYSQILDHGGHAFGTILRHVRDRPNAPFLFHCTAGKDRTGIAAAILFKLVGVEDHLVCQDYSLTRIGREPDREKVLRRLSKEPLFAANFELALRMLTSRYDTMHAALSLIKDRYGGVEAYVKNFCGLDDDDISVIRSNLLVAAKARM